MKYILFIVIGLVVIQFGGFALLAPSSDGKATSKEENSIYLQETKKAISDKLKDDSQTSNKARVTNVVFTSEKTTVVAGQKQVRLSFEYELLYTSNADTIKKGDTRTEKGSILLAKDENQNWFYSSLEFN